jgi:alkaline phosphatase D
MRRLALLAVLAMVLGGAYVGTANAADPPPGEPVFTDGVASGDVTSTAAILWTRVDRRTSVKVEVWDNGGLTGKKAFQKTINQTTADRDFTVKIDAAGLAPNTQYYYRFRHEDILSPVGTFKTAPDQNTSSDVKFTYTGDADGTGATPSNPVGPYNAFQTLTQSQAENGDFWVFLGDTIYADSRFRTFTVDTLDEYRAAHRENRLISPLPNLMASTSTYAQLDDHEVVNDFAGQTVNPARYAAGRQAFLEYYPIRESGLPHDPTCAGDPLYREFHWGSDVDVIIPDERSCRSTEAIASCIGPFGVDLGPTVPPAIRTKFPFNQFLTPTPPAGCLAAINDPSRTLLGPVQKQALKNALANSTATYKFVMSEDPIQQTFALPYDRWEGYGAERNEILDFITNNDIDNVVFLTTDQHANETNEVFKDRFENCPDPPGPTWDPSTFTSCANTYPPNTISFEAVTGPVATDTLQQEVFGAFGGGGVFAFNTALTLAGMDCRDLDTYSYGLTEVDSGAGTASIKLKDDAGNPIMNQFPPAEPCQKSFP